MAQVEQIEVKSIPEVTVETLERTSSSNAIEGELQKEEVEQRRSQLWDRAKIKIRAISSFLAIVPSKKKSIRAEATQQPKVVLSKLFKEEFEKKDEDNVVIEAINNHIQPEIVTSEKPIESKVDNETIDAPVSVDGMLPKESVIESVSTEVPQPLEQKSSQTSEDIIQTDFLTTTSQLQFKTNVFQSTSLFGQGNGLFGGGIPFGGFSAGNSLFGNQKPHSFAVQQVENDNSDDFEDEDEEEEEEEDECESPTSKATRQAEDQLVNEEQIYVGEQAILIESSSQDSSTEMCTGRAVSMNLSTPDESQIRINFHGREYTIDLSKPRVQGDPKLLRIVNEIADLVELIRMKSKQQPLAELGKITTHNHLTAVEYYLMKALHNINTDEQSKNLIEWQSEICCICQCDLIDDIENFTHEQFVEQLKNECEDDPINLEQCEAHFFHKSCLKSMLAADLGFLKCPICCKIYGVMIGDQPPGTMRISLDKGERCAGYPKNSTIIIEMNMKATKKNENYVPKTTRVGYLPNTPEARKVLEMMKLAFKRKLLFTIGRSVTTGQDNRIIWSGVHFKTNTCGGSSNFGYPDNTYLQRVTQELALKGIYPKEQ